LKIFVTGAFLFFSARAISRRLIEMESFNQETDASFFSNLLVSSKKTASLGTNEQPNR
jgi:hypothetical protein